jgi:hypothetical protein
VEILKGLFPFLSIPLIYNQLINPPFSDDQNHAPSFHCHSFINSLSSSSLKSLELSDPPYPSPLFLSSQTNYYLPSFLALVIKSIMTGGVFQIFLGKANGYDLKRFLLPSFIHIPFMIAHGRIPMPFNH